MDFAYTPDDEAFRAELLDWLDKNLAPFLEEWAGVDDDAGPTGAGGVLKSMERRRAWQRKLHAAGYLGAGWPKEYGGAALSPMRQAILNEEMTRANASQPVNLPNAGSIFKNPPGDYAARMIEECGLKGRRVGGAEISPLHANFIVNADGASAMDVIRLMEIARNEVRNRFDVELEPEIKPIGFSSDILRLIGLGSDTDPGENVS